MTTVTGPVNDTLLAADDDMWTFTGYLRTHGGGIITSKPRQVKPIGGVLTVDLPPGPVIVTVGDNKIPALVPAEDCTLAALLEDAFAYPPETPTEALAAAVGKYVMDNAEMLAVSDVDLDGTELVSKVNGDEISRVDLAPIIPSANIDTTAGVTPVGKNVAKAADASVARSVISAAEYDSLTKLAPPQTSRPARGIVVEGAQQGHGWVDTGSVGGLTTLNDTSRAIIGDQSVSRISNGAGGQSRLRRTGGTSRNFTGKLPRFLLYIAAGAHINTFAIYIGSAGLANYWRWDLKPDLQELFIDGRTLVLTLNFADAAAIVGSPNRSAITDYQVIMTDDSGGAVDWSLLRVDAVPDSSLPFPNGVLSISMDDSFGSQFNAYRYMARYDFRPTLYTIADALDASGYLTTAQLRQAQDLYGCEIGAHALTTAAHNAFYPALSPEALNVELSGLKNWMVKNGFAAANHFCYPGGKMTAAVLDAVKRYFPGGSARSTYSQGGIESLPPSESYRMRAASLSSGRSLALAKARIDNAISGKGWAHLYGHRFDGAGSIGWDFSDFQQLIDYAASSGIEVLPVGEVLRKSAAFADSIGAATLSGVETLPNKTLPTPKIGTSLLDSNGNTSLAIDSTANAVNYLRAENSAAGSGVALRTGGTDPNIGISIRPKGTAGVTVMNSGNIPVAQFSSVTNPVNWLQVSASAAGQPVSIAAAGSDVDAGINVLPKGTGDLTVGGSPVGTKVSVPATASSTGKPGQWAADANYVYYCTALNTWRRAALSTW
ncbi:polysaccharide deacetylase family protein [Mycobacterium sp. C3-094]